MINLSLSVTEIF